MSSLVTGDELFKEVNEVLPDAYTSNNNNFLNLANRAASRLAYKGAVPGMVTEIDVLFDSDGFTEVETSDYYHLLAFKVNGVPVRICAITDTYLSSTSGDDAFVDLGFNFDDPEVRRYKIPEDMSSLKGETVQALACRKYEPVCSMCDYFPINSVGALKLAMIAIFYEDKGDQTTAQNYWNLALVEMESSASKFRGPVVPTIKFFDDNITDINKPIY